MSTVESCSICQDHKKLVREKPEVPTDVHEYATKLMEQIDPKQIDGVLKAWLLRDIKGP